MLSLTMIAPQDGYVITRSLDYLSMLIFQSVAASPESTSPALAPERLAAFLDKVSSSVRAFGTEKGVRKEESVEFIKGHFGWARRFLFSKRLRLKLQLGRYEDKDVRDWMQGVAYPTDVRSVSDSTIQETLK